MREEIIAQRPRIDIERLYEMFCDMEKQSRKPEWFVADHVTRLYQEITHPNLRQLYAAGWRAGLTVNGWRP